MTVVSLQRSDSELISQTRSGNEKAFRELVTRYSPIVYNFIYRMTQNTELTQDMTQEVFVKVYKSLHMFDGKRPFKPWVLRIASNATLTELRKKSSLTVSLDALQEETPGKDWAPDARPDNDPSCRYESSEMSERVLDAIGQMDPNYRQALLLRYTEDLSYEEIAQTMNTPLNTVRTWIKRGRERLKERFREYAP